MGGRRFLAAAIAVLAGALIAPSAASATFHLMKVREVYPGAANDSYVVLQMLQPNEGFVGGHSLRVYGPTGSTIHTFTFTPGTPPYYYDGYAAPNDNHGNNTILVGDTGVEASFGVTPDDHADPALNIPASGGAVCWLDGSPPDCVSWGNFGGSLPSSAGSPASSGSVTTGKALLRSIAANCPTYLDAADDTDDSAADFSEQDPDPRNNAAPPAETECGAAPNTTIGSPKPASFTNSADASFTFTASPSAGATFECSLDDAAFASCVSPKQYTDLTEGPHTFRVRAVHPTNGFDPSPAAHTWTVDLTAPGVSITQHPADPSPGGSATFKYQSSESGSTYQCRLDEQPFTACSLTGETFTGLADGEHTFEVRATDRAQNQGNSDSYTWTVDNSLADTTPPETTITAMPSNPSDSSTATFEYSSNEPGSSFECKLDGGAFADCPATGITYTGLMSGAHSFQVRAIDPDQNIDPTPAGYSFDVVVLAPTPAPEPRPSSSPSPTPPDSSAPRPGTVLAAGPAQVRGALALLRVRCLGAPGARCGGVIRLIVRVRTRRNRHLAARNLVIGQGRHNLPAGRRLRVVRVRLTGRGRRLVSRAGRRGLRARLVGARARNRVVTLRPAKRRSSRRRGGRAGRGGARQ